MLRNRFLGGRRERKNLSYILIRDTGGKGIELKQIWDWG